MKSMSVLFNVLKFKRKTVQKILLKGLPKYGPSLSRMAKDLPVWPSVSIKHGYLTASEAMVAHDRAFVVPWITEYRRFSYIEEPCHMTAVDDISMVERHILPALPEILNEQTKTSYIKLIAAMARSPSLKHGKKNKGLGFNVPLWNHRLAAAQDGILYYARDLYDHSDKIFAAAFRSHGGGKFLMREIRTHLSFWHELGLRHQKFGRYEAEDYLNCLHALEDRFSGLQDENLASDANAILNPLCTNDESLYDLDSSTWNNIAALKVFPVRQELRDEPDYRRPRMELLASQTLTLCLRKIVRSEFAAVCWSQVPFALQNPTSNSSRRCGADGKPECSIVWEHLVFLAELAQSGEEIDVEHFVYDLQKTYEYLNLNLQDSKSTFSRPTTAIWLNVDSLGLDNLSIAAIRSSWATLENLLLDTPCDALPLLAVQPFLGRFSTLLKEIGCRSITYPQVTGLFSGRSTATSTLVNKMWHEGVLTDVRFAAEGREIAAHKIILASRSLYCKAQFNGPWTANRLTNSTPEVIKLEDMTYTTLQILIEFCYEEHLDWAAEYRVMSDEDSSMIADKLDVLLDVLTAADRWLMPDLHAEAQSQVMTGIKFFIRADNVASVRPIADEANAVKLREYCDEFSLRNAEAVLLATANDS
jgi:sacsin